MDFSKLTGVFGIAGLLFIAWLLSANRKMISWRIVVSGLVIILVFDVFVFVLPIGAEFFLLINNLMNGILDSATAGTRFVFGRLALAPGTTDEIGQTSIGFILAIQSLSTMVFFSALVGIFYYTGIMTRVIRAFSFMFTKLMKISGAESLCGSANIFVGVEAALVIRPFLGKMTRSELNTIMTTGMATIASSMLAAYITILRGQFPNIAGHLVSAAVMNVAAAIVFSKILYPETEEPETIGKKVTPEYKRESGLFEAIINSANAGVKLVVGIVGMLLAVLGLVALLDKVMVIAGSHVNSLFSINLEWTLRGLLGYVFYPLTLLIGVPLHDAGYIAKIIGERLVLTEVPAFQDLARLYSSGAGISPRSAVMATYALTGFAHIASVAIFVGGYAAIAPERTRDIARFGLRALVGANLACLMTACMSGLFFTSSAILGL
ncbi:MAG: nucleoside transporter [Bacteroidetes bacterium]|jgi:CNT family concentrative nucleoside transporter|nr:nucleoside transporter [Bacteroidota bacterium]